MKNIFKILLSSFISGVLIGIGGIVFVFCKGTFENGAIIGSFLFSMALLLIYEYKLDLFTGKVCYFFQNNNKFKLNLIYILIGNIIGASAIGYFIRLTNNEILNTTISQIVDTKLNIGLFSAFIMAFLCGNMIFLAVDTAKRSDSQFFKSLIIIICIMIFILAGFDHSIANSFYYSLANVWSFNTLLYLMVIIGGNFVGGIFFPSMFSLLDKLKAKETLE